MTETLTDLGTQNFDSPDEPSELIAEYGLLVQQHGAASDLAMGFLLRHHDNPEFQELAWTVRELDAIRRKKRRRLVRWVVSVVSMLALVTVGAVVQRIIERDRDTQAASILTHLSRDSVRKYAYYKNPLLDDWDTALLAKFRSISRLAEFWPPSSRPAIWTEESLYAWTRSASIDWQYAGFREHGDELREFEDRIAFVQDRYPGFGRIWALQGTKNIALGKYEDAIRDYQDAMARGCEEAFVHNNLGWAKLRLQWPHSPDAIRHFLDAIRIGMRNWDRGEQEAVDEYHDNYRIAFDLQHSYFLSHGMQSDAEALSREAASVFGRFRPICEQLLKNLEERGETFKAHKLRLKIAAIDESWARILDAQGDRRSALMRRQEAAKLYREVTEFYRTAAVRHLPGRVPAAVALDLQAAALDWDNQGKPEEARRSRRNAVTQYEEAARAYSANEKRGDAQAMTIRADVLRECLNPTN
jgi:tetratricopeptide (TPR) repeat protein